jgi:hypothetical protein
MSKIDIKLKVGISQYRNQHFYFIFTLVLKNVDFLGLVLYSKDVIYFNCLFKKNVF